MTLIATAEASKTAAPRAGTAAHGILLVDDDPAAIQLMGRIIASLGNVVFATTGEDALRVARAAAPDLILLDAQMPGMSGFRVMESLRAESQLADVPVIFVTSHDEAGFECAAFEMGAADYIAKPYVPSVVLARVKTHLRMKRMADELRRNAFTDCLTGIANRCRFDESLEREWRRARRAGEPVSLLLIDMDQFKSYNERYGHSKGDACLRNVAQALLQACRRPADLVARCGGQEFMALLPDTPRDGAEHVAQRVLAAVERLGVSHAKSGKMGPITASVGIASYDEASACWTNAPTSADYRDDSHTRFDSSSLVIAADRALHSAKRAGRSQSRFRDIADIDTAEPALLATAALRFGGPRTPLTV
jgi:diguanylate cyclase (GGDEF)-like protein